MDEKDKKITLLENRVSKLERMILQLQANLQKTYSRSARIDESLRRAHLNTEALKRELNRRT